MHYRQKYAAFAVIFFATLVVCEDGWAELEFTPSWQAPTYGKVREDVFTWLESYQLDPTLSESLLEIWPEAPPSAPNPNQLVTKVAESYGLIDSRARQLVEFCNQTISVSSPPDTPWLGNENPSTLGQRNLRLYYARWLAQQSYYDEVLATLQDIDPLQVVDPAALLFYRMVAYHQLVRPESCRATLAHLLEQEDTLPNRYVQLAQLIQRDLKTLQDESLDHIARRMNDVRRRLQLGRAGDQVQIVEQEVLQALDKLIKKAESQQKAAAAASSGGSSQSAKPMEDSRPAGLKAPGKVTPRDVGHQSGWGELPPKQREQAMQQIGRNFPTYYREMIEQYFKDLAKEGEQKP